MRFNTSRNRRHSVEESVRGVKPPAGLTPLNRALEDETRSTVEWIVSHLARATDEDLELFYEQCHRAAMGMLEGLAWQERKSVDDFPPLFMAAMGMRDLVGDEKYRRHDVIRHAEAELNDGHLVYVDFGDAPDVYRAYCLPGDDFCWEGSDQKTVEQALEDGRRHYSGSEPQVDPGCLT